MTRLLLVGLLAALACNLPTGVQVSALAIRGADVPTVTMISDVASSPGDPVFKRDGGDNIVAIYDNGDGTYKGRSVGRGLVYSGGLVYKEDEKHDGGSKGRKREPDSQITDGQAFQPSRSVTGHGVGGA